jgi:hypothetical protein
MRAEFRVSVSQGTPKMASNPPEAKREECSTFSFTVKRRNQTCQHLDLGSLASRTDTVHSCYLSYSECALLWLWKLWEMNTDDHFY